MPQLNRPLATAALCAFLVVPHAQAQLRSPVLPLPVLPLPSVTQSVTQVSPGVLERLSDARRLELAHLIRTNRRLIDEDPEGNPIVRNEVLASAVSTAAMMHVQSLGFSVAREQSLDRLALHLLVLHAPDGVSTRKALTILRAADPDGIYDYNHIYGGSGTVLPTDTPAGAPQSGSPAGFHPSRSALKIGLIDTGVDSNHAAFREASIRTWGCDGRFVPATHGTAVASLLVGASDRFHGVQPGAALFAADVYCGSPTGGAVDALAAAFGWLVEQQVPIVNVSLVGPKNVLLERVIAALVDRGVVVVAAVGNDGPAAPPLYPASYPHVVGVTGVDAQQHVLIEAARGPQVMFASPGADLAAASGIDGYAAVRGTSFAAPIVTGILAESLTRTEPADAATAIAALAHRAVDLGPPGRDMTYGYGLVGAEFRVDPATVGRR